MAIIRTHIAAISMVVGNVVSSTDDSMSKPDAKPALRTRAGPIVQTLSSCRDRLSMVAAEGVNIADAAHLREITSKLPPIAFEIAREVKELVQRIERLEFDEPEEDDYRWSNRSPLDRTSCFYIFLHLALIHSRWQLSSHAVFSPLILLNRISFPLRIITVIFPSSFSNGQDHDHDFSNDTKPEDGLYFVFVLPKAWIPFSNPLFLFAFHPDRQFFFPHWQLLVNTCILFYSLPAVILYDDDFVV
jgi:hypothetical protein